jgi:hypothetical protein
LFPTEIGGQGRIELPQQVGRLANPPAADKLFDQGASEDILALHASGFAAALEGAYKIG